MEAVALLFIAAMLLYISYSKVKQRIQNKRRSSLSSPEKYKVPLESVHVDNHIEPLQNMDWKTVEPLKIRIFRPKYFISMALRPDTPAELITMDQGYLERILHRRELIAKYPNTVHGLVPGLGEGPVRELYEYLMGNYLPARFPSMFRLLDGQLENLVTGRSHATEPPRDMEAALLVLGETVEEELFLLCRTPQGKHQLVAFMCCFPAGFEPNKKLGLTLDGIHGPVPGYDKIGPSMERYFAKLPVGKPVKRMNWSIQIHPQLFDCAANRDIPQRRSADPPITVDQVSNAYLRSELQTLTRLPKTQAVLFSFKTYMYKISDIKAEGSGADMVEAIQGLQKGNVPDMWNYKSAPTWSDAICEYLQS